MKQKIKVFACILVIIWMITVFYFSHQPASVSGGVSQKVIEIILNILPMDDNMGANERMQLISALQLPIRKLAHFTLYLIGGIFTYVAFSKEKYTTRWNVILSQIIVTVYAMTDEIHQYFVQGRAMSFIDVGIDSIGAFIGIMLTMLVVCMIKNRKKEEK